MKAVLLRIAVCANSLLLALPPGWCSVFLLHDRAQPAPVRASCCHQTAQDRPTPAKGVPSCPTVECCCRRDAAVPEKSVQPPDAPDLVSLLPAVTPPALPGLAQAVTADVLLLPGPRLHVLQCVWRC